MFLALVSQSGSDMRLPLCRGMDKGAKARMAALTPEQRKELARKAAQARWAQVKKKAKRPVKT